MSDSTAATEAPSPPSVMNPNIPKETYTALRSDGSGIIDTWQKQHMSKPQQTTGHDDTIEMRETWVHVMQTPAAPAAHEAARWTQMTLRLKLEGMVLQMEVESLYGQKTNFAGATADVEHPWTVCTSVNLADYLNGSGSVTAAMPTAHQGSEGIQVQVPMSIMSAPPPPRQPLFPPTPNHASNVNISTHAPAAPGHVNGNHQQHQQQQHSLPRQYPGYSQALPQQSQALIRNSASSMTFPGAVPVAGPAPHIPASPHHYNPPYSHGYAHRRPHGPTPGPAAVTHRSSQPSSAHSETLFVTPGPDPRWTAHHHSRTGGNAPQYHQYHVSPGRGGHQHRQHSSIRPSIETSHGISGYDSPAAWTPTPGPSSSKPHDSNKKVKGKGS